MAEIEVTAEMVEAGAEAMEGATMPMRTGWLPIIYRAMRALEPATVPDPIRHNAVRCAPSRADLIPLARSIEAYLRGEGGPQPPHTLRELAQRHGAPVLPAA